MKHVVQNANVTCFDCDDTLVLWPKDYNVYKEGRIEFDYGSEKVYLIPHSYHVIFLKHCFNRGDFVVVWSANGHGWASQVVEKLGLTQHFSQIMTKPTRHVDDKESLSSIVGSRVFIPHETYEIIKHD
jgi:hypothetical protein